MMLSTLRSSKLLHHTKEDILWRLQSSSNFLFLYRNFWEILHSLDLEDKKSFLIFATGSDRVPIEGMKELNFVIQRHANTTNLPTAHTCFNVFLLPEYESKEKL